MNSNNQHGLQFGIRIRCSHPNCEQQLESWSTTGTPSMPRGIKVGKNNGPGWVILSEERYYRGAGCYGNNKRAYCPNHSAVITEWLAKYWKWITDRRDAGKAAFSIVQRLRMLSSPDSVIAENKLQAIKAGWDWERDNPCPKAPWLDS